MQKLYENITAITDMDRLLNLSKPADFDNERQDGCGRKIS